LQWAREHGCPWETRITAYAALSGHLRVLQRAQEHHCPWDWLTPAWAAQGRDLEVLQWARERGCPWNKERYLARATAAPPCEEVAKWVRGH
jgi:hypothetical protein